jgi:hypothetical protein
VTAGEPVAAATAAAPQPRAKARPRRVAPVRVEYPFEALRLRAEAVAVGDIRHGSELAHDEQNRDEQTMDRTRTPPRRRGDGQRELDRGAWASTGRRFRGGAFGPDAPAMRLDDAFADGQAETVARNVACPRSWSAVELLEEPAELLG